MYYKDNISYLYSYKTEVFHFQNYPKILDPYFKTDLDFWDCFGKKIHNTQIKYKIAPPGTKYKENVLIYSIIIRQFLLQNNPKNLDPSFKTDLELWHYFWKRKT